MTSWSSRGTGAYVASEAHVLSAPKNYRPDGTIRGVIYCHAAGGTADEAKDETQAATLIRALAERWPVMACDLGGLTTWGNDTGITRVGQAKTYLQGTWGAKAGTVLLVGQSMGALTAMVWAAANLASVAAVAVVLPATDLGDIQANNRGDHQAAINTAYGGSYVDADQKAAHNPAYMATVAGGSKYAGLPYKAWYSTGDAICLPAAVTQLVTDIGATASASQIAGAPAHGWPAAQSVDPADLVAFLAAHE